MGDGSSVDRNLLLQMAGELRHRGPDGVGLLLDGDFGMVNTRLAVIDLAGGDQPIANESGRYHVVQNGEIYNYLELRAELQGLGHAFRTDSDTEVLVHAFEEWGTGFLSRLNGEFAVAIWDAYERELLLARDRFGIRPLYLTHGPDGLAFASEVRALMRQPGVGRELSLDAVTQTFQMWSTLPGTSAFQDITELPAAHFVSWRPGNQLSMQRWWQLDFSETTEQASTADLAAELRELLSDAVSLRTRADVPVGVYVSGGLDSSAITALLKESGGRDIQGFAIGFSDERFDETVYQNQVASALEIRLNRVSTGDSDIAELFPRVIELSERPMLRTAPAPLLRLSKLARESGYRVVLTGEGADEMFAGYSIFKEAMLRRFWARDPESKIRPLLFQRLHPYLATDLSRGGGLLGSYFGSGLTDTDNPLYSHHNRFRNGARNLRFLTSAAREAATDPAAALLNMLPENFADYDRLGQAQYLEVRTFMEGYLLHSQGDRMLMASGVEGRFPFLDYRVAEFAMRLPARLRLNGLEEKYLLRRAVRDLLPASIAKRTKRPYRAPLLAPFLGDSAPDWVGEILDPANVAASGMFDSTLVGKLVAKSRRNLHSFTSEMDEMALMGIMSTLLLKNSMVDSPQLAPAAEPGRVVDLNRVTA